MTTIALVTHLKQVAQAAKAYTDSLISETAKETIKAIKEIVQLVFDFTKKKLEDYMAKKSAETTTVAHFGNVGENKRND